MAKFTTTATLTHEGYLIPADLPEIESGEVYEITISKVKKRRTLTQNNCIHAYCEILSDSLNEAGWYQMQFMQAMQTGAEVPWFPGAVKENVWRKIQIPMTGIQSTADISTVQCSQVYDFVSKNVAKISGVSVPWPNRFGD